MTKYIDWLPDLLSKAEKKFGKQKDGVTISDIKFVDDGPYVYYPQKNLDQILICIGTACKSNRRLAKFQIAHEVIHCLHPNNKEDITNLEEGLAVYFQMTCVPEQKFGPNDKKYRAIYHQVRKLLEYDPRIILKARDQESNISKISRYLLLDICPQIDPILLDSLIKPFYL